MCLACSSEATMTGHPSLIGRSSSSSSSAVVVVGNESCRTITRSSSSCPTKSSAEKARLHTSTHSLSSVVLQCHYRSSSSSSSSGSRMCTDGTFAMLAASSPPRPEAPMAASLLEDNDQQQPQGEEDGAVLLHACEAAATIDRGCSSSRRDLDEPDFCLVQHSALEHDKETNSSLSRALQAVANIHNTNRRYSRTILPATQPGAHHFFPVLLQPKPLRLEHYQVHSLPQSLRWTIGSRCATPSTLDTDLDDNSEDGSSSKKVRFVTQPQIHVLEQPLSPPTKAALWYSKADISKEARHAKQLALQYCENEDEGQQYVTRLLQIWTTPCHDIRVLQNLARPILQHCSGMRGLEKHCLQVMKPRRTIVVWKVLQAQQCELLAWKDHSQQQQLRQVCEPLSRTSTRFALAMAQADAMAVAGQDQGE